MSETFFISDSHFGHDNILKFEPIARPFKNLTEMHETMINRWNQVVGKYDKVYHLGDFAFGSSNIELAKFLNGQKELILGNHDKYNKTLYLQHFNQVHGVKFWFNCILTHVPVHPMNLEGRSDFNIHGHLHSKCLPDKRYINVSVEQNNLTPINADIILQRIKEYERRD